MSQARPVYGYLLAITCGMLLVLPFVTTFDDFLTAAVINAGLDSGLRWVVPAEVRVVVSLLDLAGVRAYAAGDRIVLDGHLQALFISWNCIGWQSLILLAVSLVTGLRGRHPWEARAQVVLIGIGGTVLVNLARVFLVCLLAALAGYVPAVIFHDYGGTLMTVAWLFAFWAGAHRYLLTPSPATATA
ncbi:MAG TPA: exosortase/archaeosortase family protein [Candidatus Acidoferrales bacterium]|nr:exosortase/archaeosortase family protein [Candidatus Acidoferrales bacterium]